MLAPPLALSTPAAAASAPSPAAFRPGSSTSTRTFLARPSGLAALAAFTMPVQLGVKAEASCSAAALGAVSTTGDWAALPTTSGAFSFGSPASQRLESGIHTSGLGESPTPENAAATPAESEPDTVTAMHLPSTVLPDLANLSAIFVTAGSTSLEVTTLSATLSTPQPGPSLLTTTYAATPSSTASATAPASGTSTLPAPPRFRGGGS